MKLPELINEKHWNEVKHMWSNAIVHVEQKSVVARVLL